MQDAGLKEISEKFWKVPSKNHFRFYFFVNLKKRKWFLLEIGSPPDFQFTVARTSQSPFPLAERLEQQTAKTNG